MRPACWARLRREGAPKGAAALGREEDYFPADYWQARARFCAAASDTGARLETLANPTPGPEGRTLTCDLAWHGPTDAERVLVTISATHGVEGFCGSAVQSGWFESGLAEERPAGTALLQIHAINPHGFAFERRVTEGNIDLNRNFVEHGALYPANPGYDELAEALCPEDWSDAAIAAGDRLIDDYGERHGLDALARAVSGGQYNHSQGIFYGGAAASWSNSALRSIFARLCAAKAVAVIDYHTGLGPSGHGERICPHAPGSPALARAEAWYEGDITSPALGTSSTAELHGVNLLGMEEALADSGCALTAIALEYGTLPTLEVRHALRADNWLYVHGDPGSPKGRAIKKQIRAAFYPETRDWKRAVWERAVETQRLALAGLTES